MVDYRAQHHLNAADIEDAGVTQGHVKAWIDAHPVEGLNLARSCALLNGGKVPTPSKLADWIDSVVLDIHERKMCPVDLLEEIAGMTPAEGEIDVCDSDRSDWSAHS